MFGITPFRKSNQLSNKNGYYDLNSFIDDFFKDSFMPSFIGGSHPIKADIRETDKEYIVDAELPGMNKEDIKVELKDDTLTISVEHDEQVNEEQRNYIRKERRYGSVSRSFYVENVVNDKVNAKYENGILTITLPKDEVRKEKGHRIEIN